MFFPTRRGRTGVCSGKEVFKNTLSLARCISEAATSDDELYEVFMKALTYVRRGDRLRFFTALGLSLNENYSRALRVLGRVLESASEDQRAEIVRSLQTLLGPYKTVKYLLSGRYRITQAGFTDLLKVLSCDEFSWLEELFKELGRDLDKDLLTAYIVESFHKPMCPKSRRASLRLIAWSLKNTVLTVEDLKKLLLEVRGKLLIVKSRGKVREVKLETANEVIDVERKVAMIIAKHVMADASS